MIPNLVLLTGEDTYRLNERLRFYRGAFREKYPNGEIETLEKGESFKELQGAVMTQNLFGGKRLVICEEGFWSPEVWEVAQKGEFWDALPEQKEVATVLVTEPKPDKRTKVGKGLPALARVEEFVALDEGETVRWIEKYTEKLEGKISHSCARNLFSRCGGNLWNLSRELDKLVTAGGGEEITQELVEALTLPHPQVVLWDFTEALSRRNTVLALRKFRELLQMGESVHGLFGMVMREVRIHAQLQEGVARGLGERELASSTGLNPYVVKKTLPLSRQFDRKMICKMYEELFVIDRRLKTGGISVLTGDMSEFEIAIERFILSTCKTTH